MSTDNTWGDYSKLVLKELERLGENFEKMGTNFDSKFNQINTTLSDFKNTEKIVAEQKMWIERVNDIWSPNQMLSAKDEIYKQKNRWTSAIAIITFIQIIIGIVIALGFKFFR